MPMYSRKSLLSGKLGSSEIPRRTSVCIMQPFGEQSVSHLTRASPKRSREDRKERVSEGFKPVTKSFTEVFTLSSLDSSSFTERSTDSVEPLLWARHDADTS